MDDLQPGVRCEVRYGATPDFRAATITASDGTRLGVTYDTNEEEQNVERRRARLPGQRQRKILATGDAVDARHGSGEVRAATIKNIEGDTHTIVFDDETTQELERRYVFGEWRDEPLAEGTKIECRYRDTATFYPGAVAKANDDGTHDITYDDGEAEAGVILRRLRRPGQQQPENVDAGSRVDARRPDGGAVSPATVLGRENTTYKIRFDDGVTADVQRKHVFAAHVNANEGAADDATAAVARHDEGTGTVLGASRSQRRLLEDAAATGRLSPQRPDDAAPAPAPAPAVVPQTPAVAPRAAMATPGGTPITQNMRIECRFGLTPTFYPGRVEAIAEDGTYEIVYDDGDREVDVTRRRLRLPDQRQRLELQPGDAVDARADDGKVRPGCISGKRTDVCTIDGEDVATTLYEVAFEDGNVGEHLERHFIFGDFHDGPTPSSGPRLDVGTPVTARYRGGAQRYPGKIAAVNDDGTYDVAYDDGDAEAAVAAAFVEATLAADDAAAADDAFREGDAVEADFRGRGRYYAGKITSVREDGSYDILYEDGDAEACVAPESVRRRSEEPEVARPESGEPAFSVGDAVDARYRGRAKTYPGAIEKVHEDATYDILYEDGEREARVAEALISKHSLFAVGAAVEANYRGKGTYYPGQITALNDDGTFGVLYDDGEGELGVPAALIRSKTAAAPAPAPAPSPSKKRPQTPKEPLDESNAPLSPGMAVEARFRGRGKIYKGKLLQQNENGSFKVMYDDGDVDEELPREMVRPIAGAPRQPLAPTTDDGPAAEVEPAQPVARVNSALRGPSAVVATPVAAAQPAARVNSALRGPSAAVAAPSPARTSVAPAATEKPAPATPSKKTQRRRPKPTESAEGDALKVMRPAGARGGGGAGGVVFLPGGAVAVQAHRSRACLWLPRSAAHIGDVAGHAGRVLAVAACACKDVYHTTGRVQDEIVLLTGGSDGAACLWRLSPGPCPPGDDGATVECWQKALHKAAAKDGNAKLPKTVRLAGDDDPATDAAPTAVTPVVRKPALKFVHPRGAWVLAVDISTRGPPGLLAATAATDGIIRLWDATRGGAPVRLLAGHSWYATAVAFRPGSSELASASMDKTIRLWRYEEEESVGAPSPSLHDESTAASSAPLQLLDDDDDDAEGSTETPLAPAPHVLLRLDAAPKALAWTRDGSLLLAGGDAPAPIRFDCRGGTPVRLAELPGAGHRGAVVQIAVAADGSSAWTASQDGSCRCWALGDNDDRGGLVHALNCARTGGRVVGVAVDEAALGLDAYGERRARQRVATATADGALRLWPAPQSAVSEADAKLIEVAANGDEALSMVSAALLKGGDGNSDVDAAAAASGLLPIVRAVARRVPRQAPCYVGKGAAAEKRDARMRDLAATAGAAQRLAFAAVSEGKNAAAVARAAVQERGLLRAACEAVSSVDGGGVDQLMKAALANTSERTPASP